MNFISSNEEIDPLNFTTVKLQTYFEDTLLSNATGFFYYGILDNKPNYWLVTNWHVLAGRNVDDPSKILHTKAALPNRLRLVLVIKSDQSEYASSPDNQVLMQEQFIQLYNTKNQAMWYQHPYKNAYDVAVLNYADNFDRFRIQGVNEIAKQNDMAIQIGNEIFILGYPLGLTHFMQTPIWKRGSIASEPKFETLETGTKVLIDATTRQGMSGAPVIMREKTHYISEDGEIKSWKNATRWIGIYSSRPNVKSVPGEVEEDRRAEVGYFYKMRCVHETIMNGIRGMDFGCLP